MMRKICNKQDTSLLHYLMTCVATVGGLFSILFSMQPTAAPLSDLYRAKTFPVTPNIAKRPIPRASHKADVSSEPGGLVVVELDQPATPKPGAFDQWQRGERNWHHAVNKGLGITLGSTEVGPALFADKATLGGIHIQRAALNHSDDDTAWSGSIAVGALDYSADSKSGDLAYGPVAASTVVHYDVDNRLALESGVQIAPDLVTASLGGQWRASRWGRMRTGVAHGGLSHQRGWRYQASYDVQVMDHLRISVSNEWNTTGFADLRHYRDGAAASVRRYWNAIVPAGRWGNVRGTYENFQSADGAVTRRLGLSQQFWYSPNLRVGVQAQRELVSGDYDVGIRFSLPIK